MEKQKNRADMVIDRRPCFYQIFSSTISSHRLKIPVKFVKHLEGKTFGSVSLVGPSENVWPVELIEQNDDIFLENGWEIFVRDHFIQCGDLLVFRYVGELCFTVQVFDLSACEKETAFHSICSQDDHRMVGQDVGWKRDREEEAVSSDSTFGYMPKRIKGSSERVDNLEGGISTSDGGGCHCDEVARTERLQHESFDDGTKKCGSPAQSLAMSSRTKVCMPDLQTEAAIRERLGKNDNLNPHNRSCVSAFPEREKKVAESFISRFPYFVRIMKQFNVSGSYTLNIPYQFSTAHLPNCRTEIVLRTVKGSSWTVNSVPTTRVHTSHTLCGGWLAFVRSNDIKIGDVCIFELVHQFELRVFIVRVGKDGLDTESGSLASGGQNAGCSTSQKLESVPSMSRRKSLKVHSRQIKKVEVRDTKGTTGSQAASFPSYNAKTSSASAELCLQAGDGWRMKVALEAKAAKSVTSSFPNFVRIMRKFNVSGSYTLKVPHEFTTAHLPSCKTEITLSNLQGECWTVNSVPDSKGRAVHTFCGGWMAFVRDNDLHIGDICMFELVSKSEMRVQISGVGRKAPDLQCGKSASQELSLLPLSANRVLSSLRHDEESSVD